MKTRYVLLAVLVALVATLLLLRDLDNSAHATKAVATSLAYQADIYGGTGLETIEYLSDLQFHSWGNFGINAHVLRSRLRTSGDEIAYAISASDPDAFAFNVIDQFSHTLQLHVTNSMYSAGTVTEPATNTLHFVWKIEDQGLHLNLHRTAILESEPNVTTEHIVREEFAIENLGTPL